MSHIRSSHFTRHLLCAISPIPVRSRSATAKVWLSRAGQQHRNLSRPCHSQERQYHEQKHHRHSNWRHAFSSPATLLGAVIAAASLAWTDGHRDLRLEAAANLDEYFIQETNTNRLIPKSLNLKDCKFKCVGAGVRQITIFKINMYVASIYVEENHHPKSNRVSDLLSSDAQIVIRIEPVRETTGGHLRDGFLRVLAPQVDDIPLVEREAAKKALDLFRQHFVSGPIPSGRSILLHRTSSGTVKILYETSEVYEIPSRWLGDALLRSYIGENCASKNIRESVMRGYEEYALARGV